MLSLISRHTEYLLTQYPERIAGYAVAVVGTRRSAYLTQDGSRTYREPAAFVGTKDAASALMCALYATDRDLWRFARLVPVEWERGAYRFITSMGV